MTIKELMTGKTFNETEEALQIMLNNPDDFTANDLMNVASGRYEIRKCDICGRFMRSGYIVDDRYSCSDECRQKIESDKEYIADYYGIDISDIPENVMSLPYDEFEEWCENHGDEDEAVSYYTEWEAPSDLIDKLNARRKK